MEKIKATHRDIDAGNEYIVHDLPATKYGYVCVARIIGGSIHYYSERDPSDLEPIPEPPEPVNYDYESWRQLIETHGAALCVRKSATQECIPLPAFDEKCVNGSWTWADAVKQLELSTDFGRTWRKCVREVK